MEMARTSVGLRFADSIAGPWNLYPDPFKCLRLKGTPPPPCSTYELLKNKHRQQAVFFVFLFSGTGPCFAKAST